MNIKKQDLRLWLWVHAVLVLVYGLIYQLNVAIITSLWAWILFGIAFLFQLIIAYSLEPKKGKWFYYLANSFKLIVLVWIPQWQHLAAIFSISFVILLLDYSMISIYPLRTIRIHLSHPLQHYPYFIEQQKFLIPHVLATITFRHNLISYIGFSFISLLMVYGSELYAAKEKYVIAICLAITSVINYRIFTSNTPHWKESGMICLVYVLLGFILSHVKSEQVSSVETLTEV